VVRKSIACAASREASVAVFTPATGVAVGVGLRVGVDVGLGAGVAVGKAVAVGEGGAAVAVAWGSAVAVGVACVAAEELHPAKASVKTISAAMQMVRSLEFIPGLTLMGCGSSIMFGSLRESDRR
jgi:hypothetical protein